MSDFINYSYVNLKLSPQLSTRLKRDVNFDVFKVTEVEFEVNIGTGQIVFRVWIGNHRASMGMKLSKGEAKTNPTKCCYFPDPIVAEIISRLPVQSVLKCRSVCKAWLQLISSSHFNYYLLKNRLQYTSFILNTNEYYFCEIERTYFNHHRRRKAKGPLIKPMMMKTRCAGHFLYLAAPVGICNGLICSFGYANCNPIIIIWNPMLGQYKVLPIDIKSTSIMGLGFGYSQVTNQYKVFLTKKQEIFELEVLTIGSNSNNITWRKAGKLHGRPKGEYSFCCFQGSLYWICGCRGDSHSEWISCIDISSEKHGSLCPPLGCEKKRVQLNVVRDLLCIFGRNANGILMWSKRDCYSHWNKQIYIDLSRSFIPMGLSFVTTLWEEDKEILILESDHNICYYDYKTMKYVDLKTSIDNDKGARRFKHDAYEYFPSFVPLSQVFKEEEQPLKMVASQKHDNGGCFEFVSSILRSMSCNGEVIA